MFRFTIRDVLWLTVVVAFALGWFLDHAKTRVDWRDVEIREAYIYQKVRREQIRADAAVESNEVLRRMIDGTHVGGYSKSITQPETAQP